MSGNTELFENLPEQRKPTWQDESAQDFRDIYAAMLRMARRVKTPHLRDIQSLVSIKNRLKELEKKEKACVTK